MHIRFFPLNSRADVEIRWAQIAQEFGIYDENMPVQRFMYLSDKARQIWADKKKCIENGTIYIGG